MPYALGTDSRRRIAQRCAVRARLEGRQKAAAPDDTERDMVAAAIVGCEVERGPSWGGFAELGRGGEK
jgi:hypothetical protein